MTESPHVYRAITAITGALAKVGIGKNRKNTQQGFNFRGIDDVYDALARQLSEHKLTIIPQVVDRQVTERPTQRGGTIFFTVVTVDYKLVSAVDGSKDSARIIGEAMDSADKSTNKAMSAAYKYLAFQLFSIPIEGHDADEEHHESEESKAAQQTWSDEAWAKILPTIKKGLARGKSIDDALAWLRAKADVTEAQEDELRAAVSNGEGK